MNPRDPLTGRMARTLRETARDPYDWIEGPGELRPSLLSEREPWHRFDQTAVVIVALVGVACAAFIGWAACWLVRHW